MLKIKFLISILIFSSLLIATSVIKNQTREIEKKIYNLSNIIHTKEKDFKKMFHMEQKVFRSIEKLLN